MGCDIHFFVERKIDDKWILCDSPSWGIGQDYILFSVLGGVRNRWDIKPIKLREGFPSDSTLFYTRDEIFNYHSHNYLYLDEILEFDWNSGFIQEECISKEIYDEWDKKSFPKECCSAVSGPNVIIIEQEEYSTDLKFGSEKSVYIYAKWNDTFKNHCDSFLNEVVEDMKKLDSNPKNVRCLFAFDN